MSCRRLLSQAFIAALIVGLPIASAFGQTHPVLKSATRDATRARMRADYLADPTCARYAAGTSQKLACDLYKNALANSNNAAAGSRPYGYTGLTDAVLAMVPGNDAAMYCGRAYTQLGQPAATGFGLLNWNGWGTRGYSNVFAMHFFMDFVVMHDACYQLWTESQRAAVLTKLNLMAYGATHIPWDASWQCNDVDGPTGHYFGVALLYETTKDYNPEIVTTWAIPNVGGYTPTRLNCYGSTSAGTGKTWRNMIDYYYREAYKGGVSYEGTQYGFGIENGPFLGIYGNELLKATAAAGSFPEIDAFAADYARWIVHAPTPDGQQMAQFGDNDNPRTQLTDRMVWDYAPLALGTIGAVEDGNADRQLLQRRILDFHRVRGAAVSNPRREKVLMMVDPYATAAADLSTLPKWYFSPGAGVGLWREGNEPTDCQFFSFLQPEQRPIDHYMDYFSDWQLYCEGEWTVTVPLKYGGNTNFTTGGQFSADMHNTAQIEGIGTFPTVTSEAKQFRRLVGSTVGSDYTYQVGTQGGAMWRPSASASTWDQQGSWDPPPVFVNEHTVTHLLLGTATKTAISLLEIHRINARDPETLEKFDRFTAISAKYAAAVKTNPRWTLFLHQRTNPTIDGPVTAWATPSGKQQLRAVWLSPDDVTITKQDESTLPELQSVNATAASEMAWRTTTIPNTNTQESCVSRLVTAREMGVAADIVTRLTPTNRIGGVLLTRAGNDDRVVVWNCAPGPELPAYPTTAEATAILKDARWRREPFSVSYPQSTASAKALILDLDPTLKWKVRVDNRPEQALVVKTSGLAELEVAGLGQHELSVEIGEPAAGAPPNIRDLVDQMQDLIRKLSEAIQ